MLRIVWKRVQCFHTNVELRSHTNVNNEQQQGCHRPTPPLPTSQRMKTSGWGA
jgi:hypothetical protein